VFTFPGKSPGSKNLGMLFMHQSIAFLEVSAVSLPYSFQTHHDLDAIAIPQGGAIPHWAYLNVTVCRDFYSLVRFVHNSHQAGDTFNATLAIAAGRKYN
jgi:hypothetical protein